MLSCDNNPFRECKSVLRAQCDLHHVGEAGLALLGSGDLRGDEAVGDGQQAGGVLAQDLSVGEEGKALHLHTQAAALIPQLFPVGGLFIGGLAIEHIGGLPFLLGRVNIPITFVL